MAHLLFTYDVDRTKIDQYMEIFIARELRIKANKSEQCYKDRKNATREGIASRIPD